ncbi:hypothetical protein L5515_019385 [Caenorhabditis briggsae]|uniref:Uncharacterized protein n=1 Tax=Caenorhabditis briggsae TaxID=6238 RepID=A0AAE9JTS2_CAEBR|nr:hypothetical protein L5515_019385 [Caenorhabditis briggsae]
MGDEHINDGPDEEDDGFEDCVPGGLRPNYKIPILLTEMKEEVLDEIIQSENNVISCALCSSRFTDFPTMKGHNEDCSGQPNRSNVQEYEISQYHTNALMLSLKDMYEAGTSGMNPTRTSTRLPFHMEPFAGVHQDPHSRIAGHLAIVTCRMCKCQFLYRTEEVAKDNRNQPSVLTDDETDFDPSLIKYHVKLCPEYQKVHDEFMLQMAPSVENVRNHYNKLFNSYKLIRSGIYGSGFKIRNVSDPFYWREMGTIHEADETNRGLLVDLEKAGRPHQFRYFDFKLHSIEPESVDFVRTNYFNLLNETLDAIFFTRVTGL